MIDARRVRATLTLAAVTATLFAFGGIFSSPAHASEPSSKVATPIGTPTGGKETALGRIQRMVARLNRESSTPEGEAAVTARLAKQFHTTPDTLRAQRTAWGLGYGEVAMAYGFARGSRKPGVTPDEVVTMRREGKTWESIAKELGVKVDAVASRMTRQAGTKPKAK